MFQHRVIIIVLLLGGICSTSKADKTPIFFGEVMGESARGFDADVLYDYLGNTKDEANLAGEALAKLSKKIIDTINKSDSFVHYSRPIDEYTELLDELLLLVISIESVNKHEILIADLDEGVLLVYPEVAVSLQIADPKTGQPLYSDFELLSGFLDLDKKLNPLSGQEVPLAKRALWRKDSTTVNWPKNFSVIAEQISLKLLNTMLHSFDSTPVKCEVVRKISRDQVLINKGRTSGFFTNTRLSSENGEHILKIDESYSDYSIAKVVHGDIKNIAKWLPVTGYQTSRGSGTTLTAVSRLIFSTDVLSHPKLKDLASDETLLEDSLTQRQPSAEHALQPVYQSLMSAKLAQMLVDTGEFRMMYPVSGSRSMNNAKVRMDKALNMKKRKDDPLFFSSLVVPDNVIVGVLHSPLITSTPKIQYEKVSNTRFINITKIRTDLFLCDLYSGYVLASGVGDYMDTNDMGYVTDTSRPGWEIKSPGGILIRACVIGEKELEEMYPTTLQQAATALSNNYSGYDNTFDANIVDETSALVEGIVENSVPDNIHVDVCIERGQLALQPNTELKKTLLKKIGIGTLRKLSDNKWTVDDIVWDDGMKPGTNKLKIPLYGLNKKRNDVYGSGEFGISADANQFESMSDVDAECLLASELASYGLLIQLPPYIQEKVESFHAIKFGADLTYQGAEEFEKQTLQRQKPKYTISIQVKRCCAPVVGREGNNKTLEVDCGISLHLLDQNGKDVCKFGNANEKKVSVVNAQDYEGNAFAKMWVENVLPKFLDYFVKKRMEPALQ